MTRDLYEQTTHRSATKGYCFFKTHVTSIVQLLHHQNLFVLYPNCCGIFSWFLLLVLNVHYSIMDCDKNVLWVHIVH